MTAEHPMLTRNHADGHRQRCLQMVEEQLLGRGISDRRVLRAMSQVPRHEFVPSALKQYAYGDHPMPIGYGQTISQPLMVAYMCEIARPMASEHVLEVGSGSGYGAAVLSKLVSRVHTVERIPALAEAARAKLAALGYENVTVHAADGVLGWPDAGPYDAIIVTAGAKSLPPQFLDQLAPGGRIIIPIGESRISQRIFRMTLDSEKPMFESFGGCAFVPLIVDKQ